MKPLFSFILILFLTACSQQVYGKRQPHRMPVAVQTAPVSSQFQNVPLPQPQTTEKQYSSPKTVLYKNEARPKIVLDPGHGGHDLGTHSYSPSKYQEKHLALSTTRQVKNNLEKMGYNVYMTRTRDVFVPLEQRAEFANSRQPEVFVSIHFNSAPSKEAEGIEIFYYRSDNDKKRVVESKNLGSAILKEMLRSTFAKSRGVKPGNLSVIRNTTMPAVLVEGGFLTNDGELQRIKDPHYMEKLAQSIANGIHAYLES